MARQAAESVRPAARSSWSARASVVTAAPDSILLRLVYSQLELQVLTCLQAESNVWIVCRAPTPAETELSSAPFARKVSWLGAFVTPRSGHHQPFAGKTSCVPCQPGFAASTGGLTSCTPCERGFFADSNATVTCVPCDYGTFQPDPGASVCLNCSLGFYGPERGKPACVRSCLIPSDLLRADRVSCWDVQRSWRAHRLPALRVRPLPGPAGAERVHSVLAWQGAACGAATGMC